MINSIILTSTFPSCFKVTRIIPILKPGKSPHEIDSFCPINCLTSLEKLVESWLCRTVTEWAESNHIIPPQHHGGRRFHSTLTAKTILDQQIFGNIDKRKHSAVLATDLSAAFDTVDHIILLRKLEHHGME